MSSRRRAPSMTTAEAPRPPQALVAAQVQRLDRAGHRRSPGRDFAGHAGGDGPLHLYRGRAGPGEPVPPVTHGVVDAKPHRLPHIRLGQVQAERAEDLDLRSPPEWLGVDQQAVQIEDDRGDGTGGIGGCRRNFGDQVNFRTMSTMASPASVGFWATVTPAAESASILA